MIPVTVKELKELIKGLPDDASVDIEPLFSIEDVYHDDIRSNVMEVLCNKYNTYKLDEGLLNEVLETVTNNIIEDGHFNPSLDTVKDEVAWVLENPISETDSRTYGQVFMEQEKEYDAVFGELHDAIRESLGERYNVDGLDASDVESFIKIIINHINASDQLETIDSDGISSVIDYELEHYIDEESGLSYGQMFNAQDEDISIGD